MKKGEVSISLTSRGGKGGTLIPYLTAPRNEGSGEGHSGGGVLVILVLERKRRCSLSRNVLEEQRLTHMEGKGGERRILF